MCLSRPIDGKNCPFENYLHLEGVFDLSWERMYLRKEKTLAPGCALESVPAGQRAIRDLAENA